MCRWSPCLGRSSIQNDEEKVKIVDLIVGSYARTAGTVCYISTVFPTADNSPVSCIIEMCAGPRCQELTWINNGREAHLQLWIKRTRLLNQPPHEHRLTAGALTATQQWGLITADNTVATTFHPTANVLYPLKALRLWLVFAVVQFGRPFQTNPSAPWSCLQTPAFSIF